MATLPHSVLFSIFRFRHPGWLDPPWFVQHDLDLLDAQADVAACARVCRAWRDPAQRALLMYPAVRLTWPNSVSFFGLVHRLRGDDDVTQEPRRFIRSVLLIYDSGSHLGHAAAHTAIKEVRLATVPNGGLYIDNFPSSLFFCLDEWALQSRSEVLAAFGVRCVDVGLEPPPDPDMEAPHGMPPGAGRPSPLVLPQMPGLRQLHLCNIECSALFSGDRALDLTTIETLSLNHCHFDAVAGQAFRRMTSLGHFFLSAIVLPVPLLTATFTGWPPPTVDFGIFCVATPAGRPSTRPWNDYDAKRVSRAFAPHHPTRLVHPHESGPEGDFDFAPSQRAQESDGGPFKDRYLDVCSVWALHAFVQGADETPDQLRMYPRRPFLTDCAYEVDPARMAGLMAELGFQGPAWAQTAFNDRPSQTFQYDSNRWNQPHPALIAFHRHLSRRVGVPLRIVMLGTGVHGWGRMYVCFSPRRLDEATWVEADRPSPPSEGALKWLWNRIGRPLSGPHRLLISRDAE